MNGSWALRRSYCHHEVSILSMGLVGAGRYRGEHRRSKVSMMVMRPPQQGQGCARAGGSSIVSASVGLL
jgi:hypothetical protein